MKRRNRTRLREKVCRRTTIARSSTQVHVCVCVRARVFVFVCRGSFLLGALLELTGWWRRGKDGVEKTKKTLQKSLVFFFVFSFMFVFIYEHYMELYIIRLDHDPAKPGFEGVLDPHHGPSKPGNLTPCPSMPFFSRKMEFFFVERPRQTKVLSIDSSRRYHQTFERKPRAVLSSLQLDFQKAIISSAGHTNHCSRLLLALQ